MKNSFVKKAFIMAAGYGRRLEPMTLAVPKPMVLIANKPVMEHNIELLRKNGIKDIWANVHYHPEQIVNYFRNGADFGVHLSYSYEEKLLGTAGGVKKMAELAGDVESTFLVLSSDALSDINLKKLIKFHKKSKSLITMALMKVDDVSQFGVVVLDEDNRVISFQEKPSKDEAKSDLVNVGIYVIEPEVLSMIPDDRPYDFGKELFPLILKEEGKISGYELDTYWSDVGNINSYFEANHDAISGKVNIKIGGKEERPSTHIGKGCRIDPSVRFEGVVLIGDRVTIHSGAVIKDSIIGDLANISSNVIIANSIVWPDTVVFQEASITDSVIGSWSIIGERCKISERSIISNRVKIGNDLILDKGREVKPKEIL